MNLSHQPTRKLARFDLPRSGSVAPVEPPFITCSSMDSLAKLGGTKPCGSVNLSFPPTILQPAGALTPAPASLYVQGRTKRSVTTLE